MGGLLFQELDANDLTRIDDLATTIEARMNRTTRAVPMDTAVQVVERGLCDIIARFCVAEMHDTWTRSCFEELQDFLGVRTILRSNDVFDELRSREIVSCTFWIDQCISSKERVRPSMTRIRRFHVVQVCPVIECRLIGLAIWRLFRDPGVRG